MDNSHLPYGMYTTPDRQILFDRGYSPIWERKGEGYLATPADPEEWVQPVLQQGWFLTSDRNPWPRLAKKHRDHLSQVLEDFKAGLPVHPAIAFGETCALHGCGLEFYRKYSGELTAEGEPVWREIQLCPMCENGYMRTSTLEKL